MSKTPYQMLEERFLKIHNLRHLHMLAVWDLEVMMPPKGALERGNALTELSAHIHELMTHPDVGTWLTAAEDAKNELSAVQQANLREMRLHWRRESALSDNFLQRKVKLSIACRLQWAKSRATNDFATFLPYLKEMIALVREEAQCVSILTGHGLYESLFNLYEGGMSLEALEGMFENLKSWLPDLLQRILAAQRDAGLETILPKTPFPRERQEALSRHLMKVWGFDFEAGRIDVSAHPFTTMVREDSRITTHYNAEDFTKALFATIHETGHSRYGTNCGPKEMYGQPVCRPRSYSIDESQSRFAEVVIGRSRAFAEFLVPLLREYLGESEAFTVENLQMMCQKVQPGHIRIAADEVCYPLHILLRYEIERALVEGTMEAEDIPRVWGEKMKEYLGVDTEGRDDIGCLQDIHWSMGAFGYFPTYSLGSMFAAQLMMTIKQELGEETVNGCIRTGEMEPIFAKQKEKVWEQGSLYETEDLIVKATGEKLNLTCFREYLERRYLRHED